MFSLLRSISPWISTTILSIILILSNQNQLGKIVRGHVADALITASAPIAFLHRIANVWEENRTLHRTLAEMSLDLVTYMDSYHENIKLRKMLGFSMRSDYEVVGAEVMGFSEDVGIKGLIINKGKKYLITENQAVITMSGLVGRICYVGSTSATVQLLTDPNLGVAARFLRKRENGILHSARFGRLVLNGIPVSTAVMEGDTVITSGMGGIFPKGIVIGTVLTAEVAENNWLWDIYIKPSVEFGRVEEVFVIKGEKGAE